MIQHEWNVLCDFDGTISVEDVIDSLLDRYGRPGWERLEKDWREGLIGSRACMDLAWVPLDFASIDDYLGRLSASRRKNIRRKLRSRALLEVEEMPTGSAAFMVCGWEGRWHRRSAPNDRSACAVPGRS